MSPLYTVVSIVLIFGICTFPNTNARFRRVYQVQEDIQQSQDISQSPQQPERPPLRQTKPYFVNQNQQRPQVQEPFPSQNQQRPQVQEPFPSQNQQFGQTSQTQQRPKPSNNNQQETDDFSDENETQFEQDVDKFGQELDKQAEQNGHKGKPTKDDAKVVADKNSGKPWYVRLKNWGEKQINKIG